MRTATRSAHGDHPRQAGVDDRGHGAGSTDGVRRGAEGHPRGGRPARRCRAGGAPMRTGGGGGRGARPRAPRAVHRHRRPRGGASDVWGKLPGCCRPPSNFLCI